jgi:putative DNA primase/helicase
VTIRTLAWDGEHRLDSLLVDRFGAEDTELVRQIARRWLIGAVARVFAPGCKLDTMVVLVGAQGVRKSTGCAALVPEPGWFTDTAFDVSSKDAMVQLQGVWMVEIAELQSLRKSGADAVKAFLSSRRDRFRRPYGRIAEDHPRQVTFVGTTNDEEFLVDATGSRRFWPVRVGKIDVDGICTDRDQLWAEAVAAYRAGERWWLDAAGEAALRELSRAHEVGDPWEEAIRRWVAQQAGPFTVERVLAEAVQLPVERMDRSKRTRAGQVLARLGCTQTRPRGTSSRSRVWVRS